MRIKVTVEYFIDDFITEEELALEFNNSAEEYYNAISDNKKDHPLSFADNFRIIKIEKSCEHCCECDLRCNAFLEDGYECTATYRKDKCPVCNVPNA